MGLDALQPLFDSGAILVQRPGVVLLRGLAARLFDGIDRDVRKFSRSFGAEETILPVSIGLDELGRSGYRDRFPQFLHLLSTLNIETGKPNEPESACCPAVCLPAYPSLAHQVFETGQHLALSARGTVFRHETPAPDELERLTEFRVRDIIFFGSEEYVEASLASCLEWLKRLLDECRLQGGIEPATDPFFGSESEALSRFQQATQSKFELRLKKPAGGEPVAVSSVNNHGTHFSKSFSIRYRDGEFVHSGCFGVGLERLLLLIFFQHGTDETRWPELLRR